MQFQVIGACGETVADLSHTSGTATKVAMSDRYTDRPKEPAYKIVTSEDQTVSQGKFEYG